MIYKASFIFILLINEQTPDVIIVLEYLLSFLLSFPSDFFLSQNSNILLVIPFPYTSR